jgi:hypothetical protein
MMKEGGVFLKGKYLAEYMVQYARERERERESSSGRDTVEN